MPPWGERSILLTLSHPNCFPKTPAPNNTNFRDLRIIFAVNLEEGGHIQTTARLEYSSVQEQHA